LEFLNKFSSEFSQEEYAYDSWQHAIYGRKLHRHFSFFPGLARCLLVHISRSVIDSQIVGKSPIQQKDIVVQFFARFLAELNSLPKLPVTESLSGRMGRRTQGNVYTFPLEVWEEAWQSPFHGDVLKRLELKLHSNSVMVVTEAEKEYMSRIIPVVQSSGTGKSRLAEE
jgi:hypothetical protein